MATVELREVSKSFGEIEAVHGVDLDIEEGEFAVFVGPSGCGKSTLLRLIAGLETITAGEIWIGGDRVNDLPPARRGIAMVFQSYALYPHMTVFDNMAFGLKLAKFSKNEIQVRVQKAAAILQLDELLGRKPRQLSGGQRQRVAIGRAIVREPRVFLFDEPLSNLDAKLRVQTRIEVARLHDRLDATMIYVTHDQVEAMTLADKIVVLNAGTVEQVGRPMDLYNQPANLFVAGFLGSPQMNFLGGTVTGANGEARLRLVDGTTVKPPTGAGSPASGTRVTLGVRPEHLVLAEEGDVALSGQVLVTEKLGDHSLVHMALSSGDVIIVKIEGETALRQGESISAAASSEYCHLFDELGSTIVVET